MDPITGAVELIGAAAAAETAGTAVVVGAAAVPAAEAVGVAASAVESGAAIVAPTAELAAVAPELTPNIPAADAVLDLAVQAEAATDPLAGEVAIRQFTELSPQGEAEASAATNSSLEQWDKENPAPDSQSDPEGYKKWCENRWSAEIDEITNARTEATMKQWEKQNPEPDQNKEPEKHKQWTEARKKLEQAAKTKINKETNSMKEAEKAHVLEEINRLRILYQERMDIINGINALRRKTQLEQTDQDKIDLARFQVRKADIEMQINAIEASLSAKAGNSGPLIALMISAAMIGMLAYKAAQVENIIPE